MSTNQPSLKAFVLSFLFSSVLAPLAEARTFSIDDSDKQNSCLAQELWQQELDELKKTHAARKKSVEDAQKATVKKAEKWLEEIADRVATTTRVVEAIEYLESVEEYNRRLKREQEVIDKATKNADERRTMFRKVAKKLRKGVSGLAPNEFNEDHADYTFFYNNDYKKVWLKKHDYVRKEVLKATRLDLKGSTHELTGIGRVRMTPTQVDVENRTVAIAVDLEVLTEGMRIHSKSNGMYPMAVGTNKKPAHGFKVSFEPAIDPEKDSDTAIAGIYDITQVPRYQELVKILENCEKAGKKSKLGESKTADDKKVSRTSKKIKHQFEPVQSKFKNIGHPKGPNKIRNLPKPASKSKDQGNQGR